MNPLRAPGRRPHAAGHRVIFCVIALLALLLSGCATVPAGGPDATPPGTAPAVQAPASAAERPAASRVPQVFQGPLSEIVTVRGEASEVVPLAAPADLWDRIRRGLRMQDLDTTLVRDQERWYAGRPEYLVRMKERSRKYLFHIVEEVERRDLPMELALLPFIESAFNPQAVSRVKAAGMWQFMPATGQSFDLKQNAFRDDRRDVLASTRAALDYLEQLHARFGDWHLALAAYNWGQGNVNRAITRNQREGLPTGYTDLTMPRETRQYVPKLQAVENIIAHPERFGVELPLIGNHPFFDTITIERDMDVALIARLAEVDEADFRSLNPSLIRPVVMAAATPNILLPWDNAAIFERNLRSHEGPLASWTAWVVPSTMSAAQAAKRVGMTETQLRKVNGIPPRMMVRAGSSLIVPRNDQRSGDVPEHVADTGRLALQPEGKPLRRVRLKARQGDTVAVFARRHGVSPVSVAQWNGLGVNARLRSGQLLTLMLPPKKAQKPAARTKAPVKRAVAQKQPPRSAPAASKSKPPVRP
ncbi:MAG: LysM peptidoglycan-binding domain-containing protein [Burkholderiales bacterium]|nr:MAG: LysM peptidoglycan-binding domain-containing protein [Burkholderiales bacterium]